MKALLFVSALLMSISSFATVDGNTSVYILSQHVQSAEYFVQKVPVIGCWGLSKGPELSQLTAEYKVPSNVGCGITYQENINSLSCAKVDMANESSDYNTFDTIRLDISDCQDKDNKEFIDGIKKVVKMNFATKTVKNPTVQILKYRFE